MLWSLKKFNRFGSDDKSGDSKAGEADVIELDDCLREAEVVEINAGRWACV